MNLEATMLPVEATLSAVVIRANGDKEDLGVISSDRMSIAEVSKRLKRSKTFWERVYLSVKEHLPLIVGGAALAYAYTHGHLDSVQMALVTTAGVNILATNFLASPSTALSSFKWIDCGTGTTAAAIGDTALQTPAGTARVSGTQSNPSSGVYAVSGTIAFTSSLAITEFGLFSASTSGTLWDHRIFAAINVASGDSIVFPYQVICTAGGS